MTIYIQAQKKSKLFSLAEKFDVKPILNFLHLFRKNNIKYIFILIFITLEHENVEKNKYIII